MIISIIMCMLLILEVALAKLSISTRQSAQASFQ